MLRTILAFALVAAGLALAAGTTHARGLPDRLPDAPGGEPSVIGDAVANHHDFAPFTFAVIGPVRGDHAALDRAYARIEEETDAALVVIVGDLLGEPNSHAPLAAVVARRLDRTVLLAGPGDDVPFSEDPGVGAVVRAPTSWTFRHADCIFVGATNAAERAAADPSTMEGVATFAFSGSDELAADDGALARFTPPGADAGQLAIEVVTVNATDAIARRTITVDRGPSFASRIRDLQWGVLLPAASSTTSLIAVLLACVACVLAGLRIARRPVVAMS